MASYCDFKGHHQAVFHGQTRRHRGASLKSNCEENRVQIKLVRGEWKDLCLNLFKFIQIMICFLISGVILSFKDHDPSILHMFSLHRE